jgi:hypothetical protein
MKLAVLVLTALVATGCAVGEAQAPAGSPETACRVDRDCVIIDTMPSCGPCGSCGGAPRAVSARWLARETRRCAAERRRRERVVPRQPPPRCGPCMPPPPSASLPWEAACHAHVCEAFVADAGVDSGAAPGDSIDDLLTSP